MNIKSINNHPLKLYPFGGVGEFGKNMMIYAWGKEAIMLDCGIGFPEPSHHGVDALIPDISALKTLELSLTAIVLTHGHEDHIGALPYLLPRLRCPVYGSEMTLGLVRDKLARSDCPPDIALHLLRNGDNTIISKNFSIEAIPVTHSIMDAVSIVIRTPVGIIIHTGDFRFDPSPLDGRASALHRFAALGDEGVLLLASDSTNATSSGAGEPERSVGPAIQQVVSNCAGKVVLTTFSSNMFRIQQILDVATDCKRKVIIAGRSLERNTGIARDLNRLRIAHGLIISVKEAAKLPANKVLILATGSQGESRAALARIAHDRFKGLSIGSGDLVLFSSSVIPGNERVVANLYSHIYRRGARIVHSGHAHLHVSGHAKAYELKTMLQLTRPKFFYPVHGEYRYLVEHTLLAKSTGIPSDNIVLAENGQSVELTADNISLGETFHAAAVFVDGEFGDEIDYSVLRDRRKLAEEGMVTAIVVLSAEDGSMLSPPELVARGVFHQAVGDELLALAIEGLVKHISKLGKELCTDSDAVGEEIRLWLRRWFRQRIGRKPMVMPVIMEV
ncbi:MAG: ribonuclease J [Mariprofundales bacterium]